MRPVQIPTSVPSRWPQPRPLWDSASRCVTMSFRGPSSAARGRRNCPSQVHRNGPPQQGPDALVHRAGRLRLHVPSGRLDPQHIGGVDLRDQPAADTGEGIAFEAGIQFCAYHRSREPPRFCSSTRSLFSATVGTPAARRSSEGGSPTGLGQILVGEACSRAAASETSPAAPPDGIERGRSERTAPSGCATGPRARDAKSTTGTKTTRTRRARGGRRTTGRRRKEGYEGKRESTRYRSRSRPRAGSSRLGAMPPMRS